VLDYFIIAIALLIIYKRKGGQRLQFSWRVTKRMISVSRYYLISNLMITVFAQTDKIMLTIMMNEEATGYYSAAITCAGMTSFVFTAIIDSARPAILESLNDGEESFERNLSRLYCIVIWLALLQSVGMTIFASLIISLIYGAAYKAAIPVLQIIVWYTTFSYYGGAKDVWVLAKEKQKYLVYINLFGAIANVVLNALLIPAIGIIGAAMASLITQIFSNVVMMIIIKPLRRNNRILLNAINPKTLVETIKNLTKK